MLKEYKDFIELQRDIREDFSPLLRLVEVRSIIGCSLDFVLELVRDGQLEAVNITGHSVDRATIDRANGLRVLPSSLKDFLDRNTIK